MQPSAGIVHVLVAGTFVVRGSAVTGALPGQPVREPNSVARSRIVRLIDIRSVVMGRMRFQHLAFVAAVLCATQARADNREQVRARMIEAINKRDTRTVESLVAFPLRAEKVRFASETCRKFWGVSVLVNVSELSAFVDGRASQKVTALTTADTKVNAIFGPGFPLGIAFNVDDKVIALTSSSEPGSKPLRIEPSTFASHVTNFTREIVPSKDTQQTLDARHAK